MASRTNKAAFLISIVAACLMAVANAFVSAPLPAVANNHACRFRLNNDSSGGMEEIEFRIYPDGRVTEVVRGVKGQNCEKVTEAINKQLGDVIDSSPTEEMFEQEVTIDQTIEQKEGWEGSSSW